MLLCSPLPSPFLLLKVSQTYVFVSLRSWDVVAVSPASINSIHLSIHSSFRISLSWFLQVSLRLLTMFKVLLMDLILSFIKALSALLTICRPLGVFMFLVRRILTGTSPFERHLRVNLLWLAKSAIFLLYFSHRRKIFTFSLPYSVANFIITSTTFMAITSAKIQNIIGNNISLVAITSATHKWQ